MPNTLYLIPAYGKVYKSSEAMLRAWYGGLDFLGKRGYCSIRDVELIRDLGYSEIRLSDRYGYMTIGMPV